MSYILEALKKAQAERQLGHSPTIHAPTLQAGAQAAAGARLTKPLMLALAGMAVAIAVLLVMILRPSAAPAVATAPASNPVARAAVPEAPPATQALPTPVAALPPPVATVTPVVPFTARAESTVAATPAAATAAVSTTAAPPAAAARSEEPVLNLRELPEPIQRAIPQVAVGGYIYSKNPADRLLLVDKILRREGEEVAPGLLLEKLNPKEAVFSFKGYRYRVPY